MAKVLKSSGWCCTDRGLRIIQETFAFTERGAMIAWLEGFAFVPVRADASDGDVSRAFYHWTDKQGGFVRTALCSVNVDSKHIRNREDG